MKKKEEPSLERITACRKAAFDILALFKGKNAADTMMSMTMALVTVAVVTKKRKEDILKAVSMAYDGAELTLNEVEEEKNSIQ